MPEINQAQEEIRKLLFAEVYDNLTQIGLPLDDCSRDMSWDEAYMECDANVEAIEDINDTVADIFKQASKIYREACDAWDAIMNCRHLFIPPK